MNTLAGFHHNECKFEMSMLSVTSRALQAGVPLPVKRQEARFNAGSSTEVTARKRTSKQL